ncbi:hypothetical protein GOV09_02255 [Candidatus Woesearchaeota archaeon]|nr:hypothetical protein [Candidatus Woesearchaeota archaeon]
MKKDFFSLSTPAAFIALVLFIILFLNFIPSMTHFPLSTSHQDYSSHMGRIHFLREYGYAEAPNWYNGFHPFQAYYFGYYFFALPIYLLTDHLPVTVFITIVLMYVLSLFIILRYSSLHKGFSGRNTWLFFGLFFFNPIFLFDTLNLGRLPEALGWTIFALQSFILFYHKKKEIKGTFIMGYAFTSAALIVSNTMIYFLSLTLLAGFFLIRNFRDKIRITATFLLSLLLTSFWWIPLFLSGSQSRIGSFYGLSYLQNNFSLSNPLLFTKNIYHDIVILAFLFVFFITLRQKKKEGLFFLPAVILSVLYLFKITYFLPVINIMYHLIFVSFFWFLFLYLLFTLDFSRISRLKKIVFLVFVYQMFIPLLIYVPFFANLGSFTHNPMDLQAIDVADAADERFIVVPHPDYPTIHRNALVSYITIINNATTTMGWITQNADPDVLVFNQDIISAVQQTKCDRIISLMTEQKITQLVTFGSYCEELLVCDLTIIKRTSDACLFYE